MYILLFEQLQMPILGIKTDVTKNQILLQGVRLICCLPKIEKAATHSGSSFFMHSKAN